MALEPDYDTRNSQGASALEWETHKVRKEVRVLEAAYVFGAFQHPNGKQGSWTLRRTTKCPGVCQRP